MPDQDKLDLSIFLDDYLNDAKEGFQAINTALLALEKDHSQIERLDEIFRVLHTLKSASTMLGFSDIVELVHFSEDFLARLRKHELPISQGGLDLLFEIIDTLEGMVRGRARRTGEKSQAGTTSWAPLRIEEFKQKLTLLESQELLIRQGVIVINEQGVIEFLNPAAERMFGYSAAEMTGQKINTLMPEPYKSQHDTYLHNYLSTGRAKIIGIGRELVGLHKNGSTFPLELAVSEMYLGGRRLFIGIVRDITGRKRRTPALPVLEKTPTIRVNMHLLDSLFNLAGELIITKSRIDNIVVDTIQQTLTSIEGKELKATLAAMDRLINEVQQNVSAARLVRVDEIFQKFPRMVRDLAREANKEVELILVGNEIELDKAVLDAIGEPLIHLLRNAVSHGIEPIEIRQKQNKQRRGTIKLVAKRAETHILIDVEDDGRGIDPLHIKEVALRKGFIKPEEAESLKDSDILDLIFKPGFSSAEEVTGVSGRGVGLDVVRTSIKGLSGTVEVATQKGKGTRFTLRLPLTTAIIQTLMVGVDKHLFAIPSNDILETLEIKSEDIKMVQNEQVLVLRKEVIPFVRLDQVLNIPRQEDPRDLIAVILYRGDELIALGVDMVLDQMENIIKPFDPIAQQFKGFSGGTILGDGRVALLLDIAGLFGREVYSI